MLTALPATRRGREIVTQFYGLNQNEVIAQGEFSRLDNLIPCEIAAVKTREKRGVLRKLQNFQGILGKEKLFWVEDNGIYYDGGRYGSVAPGEKQLLSMGALVLIFPDKLAFNTDTKLVTPLENTASITGGVTVSLARQDGTAYTGYTTGTTAPQDPQNGTLWLDTSNGAALKEYAAATQTWAGVLTTYLSIQAAGIGKGFKQHDGVTLSGVTAEGVNGDVILQGATDNSLLITGILAAEHTQTGGVTVSRKLPDMDFFATLNNRVWGCSGKNHEIYACKLGDPTNWRCYEGLSTDSYAATVGSDGDFTGAAAHLGYVLFFKEACVHKLYGTVPGNFQLTEINFRGVEKGSEKSLCVVNEVLYYKAKDGVVAYDGMLPRAVGGKLLPVKYHSARAGRQGSDLYLSMLSQSGSELLVLDTEKGLWRREGTDRAAQFASCQGQGYYVRESDGRLIALSADAPGTLFDDVGPENEVAFAFETGDLLDSVPDYKRMARIQLRLELETGGVCKVAVSHDDGPFLDAAAFLADKKRFYVLPIAPRRCRHIKIRLSGTGKCTVYGISMYVEKGSDFR